MSEIEQEKQLTHHMIPIKWNVPDNIQSLYASNVFVQACEYEISLLFFETQLPLLTGSSEEIINQLKEIDAVQAKCVAKIVVNPELVPKLIQALQTGLDKYQSDKKMQEREGNK